MSNFYDKKCVLPKDEVYLNIKWSVGSAWPEKRKDEKICNEEH